MKALVYLYCLVKSVSRLIPDSIIDLILAFKNNAFLNIGDTEVRRLG